MTADKLPRMWLQRIAQFLVYFVFRATLCAAQSVPLETCQRAFRLLSVVLFDVIRFRRGVILDNLRHAFPHWTERRREAVARQMWEHLLLSPVESALFHRKIHATNWRDYLHLGNTAEFTRLMLGDRPLVMVGGHFGSIEFGGYITGHFGYRTYAVARPLDNPFMHRWALERRTKNGPKILSKQGDHERIRDILAAGGAVTFLADQYAGSKGCWVEFFGRPASAHKAVALFALDADALILAGHCRRAGRPLEYEMTLDGLADTRESSNSMNAVRDLTQWYTQRLEDAVRQAPEQYWWVHRRWKDRRAAHKAARRRAA